MVIEKSNVVDILAEVDRTHRALRAGLRPLDHKTDALAGGHYRTNFFTGATTVLNAADAIASLRWSSASLRFVLLKLRAFANIGTAFGTAQEVSLDLVKMVNFSVADTGGTAVSLGSGNMKGPGMQPSSIADLRASTTTALGAGTGTAESRASGFAMFGIGNTVGASAKEDLFDLEGGSESPLILDANQGFRIRIGVTQGATGVVRYSFVMDWAEIPALII